MFYDLNAGVVIKISKELEKELSEFLVKKTADSLEGIKVIIECSFEFPETVFIKYKGKEFKYQHNNWVAKLFQLLPSIYLEVLPPQFILLHGASFTINNNVVFLLGHSRSGKSTALYKLLCDYNIKYISDEIIAIDPCEKCILPLSNKPIQLREDILSPNNQTLFDDAWNMKKIGYVHPEIKEENVIPLKDYRQIYCFLKYDKSYSFEVKLMNNYNLLNSMMHSCFNVSRVSKDLLISLITENVQGIYINYNGNIEEIYEVLV